MFIIRKNGIKITNDKEWFKLAPPEGKEKQWVDKHSAKELAIYFTKQPDTLPIEVKNLLLKCNIDVADFECEPESKTNLSSEGFGENGDRQHDLLMVGNDAVVGVEAKATESLDDYVTNKYKGTENHNKRYKGLCEKILGKDIFECSNIRYQLLSASIGTLIEAKKRNYKKAIVLIILFSSELTTEKHISMTKTDIQNFKDSLKKLNDYFITPYAPDIELSIEYLEIPLLDIK